jgi:hypothetical protein
MEAQRLMEHGVQVRQPRKMILGDHRVLSAHLLDLLVETVLTRATTEKSRVSNCIMQENVER